MTISETKPNPIHVLRDACKAFNDAVENYDHSMTDGVNVHGAIGGVIGHAENVLAAAEALCSELERKDNPTHDDVVQAALNSTFIRLNDEAQWLRLDTVDTGQEEITDCVILAHDENTQAPGDEVIEVGTIDPKAVSFRRLVEFKL